MSEPQISGKTTITLASWWQITVIIAVIMSCYFGLKADSDKAILMSAATAAQQAETDKKVNAMQFSLQSVADDVKWFRQTYEKDMNHYIRDSRTR